MAPKQDGRRKGENHYKSTWSTHENEESNPPLSSTTSISAEMSMGGYTPVITEAPAEVTRIHYDASMTRKRPSYPWYSERYSETMWSEQSDSEISSTATWSTITKQTPHPDSGNSVTSSVSPTSAASYQDSWPSIPTSNEYEGRGPGPWTKDHTNNAPLYAIAAIVPVVVLAAIGCIFFVCLRRRKKGRQQAATVRVAAQEMKMQTQHTVQPYLAPPTVLPQYTALPTQMPPTSIPSQMQPVILGPISSSSNGAYLTGMDTSDVVSVMSNNLRPVDPFSDNSSLTEPPPPYRPRSIGPPSFVSTSRQSSLRFSAPPPATSQTHLIERSPFDDPQDDDNVSQLSTPTVGRGDDTMSMVSELSYQQDPVVGRWSL